MDRKKHSDPLLVDDLYLAAGVTTLSGCVPELSVNGNRRVVFMFPADRATQSAVSSYHTGKLHQFSRNLKTLRARMHEVLNGGSR